MSDKKYPKPRNPPTIPKWVPLTKEEIEFKNKFTRNEIDYERYSEVLQRKNKALKKQVEKLKEYNPVKISEKIKPKLTAHEEAFFIAGFQECQKLLKD